MTPPENSSGARAGAGMVLLTLATGQFLMMLDSSVMNVSIATVAADLGTTVSGIQVAITLYMLVMATMMITGGMIGRRRAFSIGCVVYGAGSLVTALAPQRRRALSGLVAAGGPGRRPDPAGDRRPDRRQLPPSERPRAYGLIAAAAAVAVATGPLIGGFATTYFSWRYVFAGEVVLVAVILVVGRRIQDAPAEGRTDFDAMGAVLWVAGLGLAVFAVLQSGAWGWVAPTPDAPTLLGLSAVTWMLLGGIVLLRAFVAWMGHRVRTGRKPLIRLAMLDDGRLRGGLTMFLLQFFIQAGVFFVVPLFLSVALGLSAFDTGLRLLPLSLAVLIAAAGVPKLLPTASPRRVVQAGLALMGLGLVVLIGALEVGAGAEVVTVPFILIGLGVGALSSQLGAVTVSSMPDELSGEVGGLQNTVTNLGAALGTALAGSVLIGILTTSFLTGIQQNPAVPAAVAAQAEVRLASGAPFISDAQLATALDEARVSPATAEAVTEQNTAARIQTLRASLLLLALVTLLALFFTRRLPSAQIAAPASGVELLE